MNKKLELLTTNHMRNCRQDTMQETIRTKCIDWGKTSLSSVWCWRSMFHHTFTLFYGVFSRSCFELIKLYAIYWPIFFFLVLYLTPGQLWYYHGARKLSLQINFYPTTTMEKRRVACKCLWMWSKPSRISSCYREYLIQPGVNWVVLTVHKLSR